MSQDETGSASPDLLDQVVGISPESRTAVVRAKRPDVTLYAQSSYDALFSPTGSAGLDSTGLDFAGLGLAERVEAALRVATLEESQPLMDHYGQWLKALDNEAHGSGTHDSAAMASRRAAILQHVDLLTLSPIAATPDALIPLQQAGLSTRNIVTLSQLIAFLGFQVRAVATLTLFTDAAPSMGQSEGAEATRDHGTPSSRPVRQAFTLDPLGWDSWLDTLNLAEATPEQVAVLEESTATAKTSPYYLLLVQDVDVLRARSRLYNAIMYGPRGLRRADRELGALAVSRINGCAYCASIHAQRFTQLTKEPEVATRVWADGLATPLEPRRRAIVDFAAKLTDFPSRLTTADLTPLRQQDFSDWEIMDLANAVAVFAWANRLMQTLGEPVPATDGT